MRAYAYQSVVVFRPFRPDSAAVCRQPGSCSPGCCADASGCRTSRCSRRDPRAATTSPRTLSGGCTHFSCWRRGSHAAVVIGVPKPRYIFDDSPLNPLSRPEYFPVPPGSAGSSAPQPSSSGSTRPLSAPALCTSSSPNNRSCGRRSLRTSFGWLHKDVQVFFQDFDLCPDSDQRK